MHLYGRPAAVEPLLALGVPVIEDAAQAHGALTGVTGTAAIYSFYPTKNVGGIGDGGAVVTPDPELAATVRRLRVHGMTEQYVHVDISQNFRMSELEAAWLALQLPHLAADNHRRAAIAGRYRRAAPSTALARRPRRPRRPPVRACATRTATPCGPRSPSAASPPACTTRWR